MPEMVTLALRLITWDDSQRGGLAELSHPSFQFR